MFLALFLEQSEKMRLSTIFELLLILLLVAFAAYGRVIDRNETTHRVTRAANNVKQSDIDLTTMSLKQATDSVNRYCTCNENICNCCRDFHIPLVQLKGPGCASLQYLQGDNLAVQLSFGDNILTSTIVNGKNPKPVCVPLPGGFTQFCGRIYSIQRDAKNHFKACLGLELQSPTELEATLRVSCFRFGPDGLKLRPAEPLPTIETDASSEEDDDDDFFGLGSDDDEDDEDDERPITNSVPDGSEVDAQESDDDDDDDDPLGFSALLDIFTGDDEVPTRPKVTTAAPLLEFTIPILPRPTTPAPLEDHELSTFSNEQDINYEEHDSTEEPFKAEEEEEEDTGLTENNTEDNSTDENKEQITESSNKIVYTAKPDKTPIVNKVKKGVIGNKKKPTVTSTSINAIHDPEKPVKKPIKDEDDDDDDILDDDDDEDLDDEDDSLEDDDDDDKDDEDEDEDEDEDDDKLDDEKHEELDDDDDDEKDLADLDDDDDEEENAMLSALIGTGKNKKSKEDIKSNQTNVEHDDDDYGFELGFLGRKRHFSENQQRKITRL
ncbi:PREDICTED: zinc finger protein hangover-like [Cyphomyrmex costatus]|uniref:zinc finger protein hangover-like n=1 Tax=Cyphomyrmex costatus TaxID=456900 RepID=UPI0008524239|nr:PREDICTED: zinc finger protein hangover-like [Cyphomyrmex costatus]